MEEHIEIIKNKICKIIYNEREMMNRRYTLWIEDVEQLIDIHDIYTWINNYSYIFSKYGKEDLLNISLKF